MQFPALPSRYADIVALDAAGRIPLDLTFDERALKAIEDARSFTNGGHDGLGPIADQRHSFGDAARLEALLRKRRLPRSSLKEHIADYAPRCP